MPERSPEEIQRDIEQARVVLASAIDRIAYRADPKRVSEQAKSSAVEWAQTPAGKAVLGGVGALFVLYIVWRVRR